LQKYTQNVEHWEKVKAEGDSICFGTRDLFRKQFFLEENGYKDHAAWLQDWQARETRGYFCLGAGGSENNRLARIIQWDWAKDGADLVVQMNVNGKRTRIQTHITQHVHELHFAHENKHAISVEVIHDQGWHIHFSWDYGKFFTKPTYDVLGYLGVDFNDGYLTVWHVSHDGNPLHHWDYHFKGKTAEETKSNLARGIKRHILPYARKHSLLLVVEDIDFARKKWRDHGKRHNHRLSQWLTAWYQHVIQYRCLEQGVKYKVVNPAYTTVVGYVKYGCGRGLRTHDGAAITIGRRGGNFSERVKSVQMTGPCPRPVRIDGNRHPWAAWATSLPASALQAVNGKRKQNKMRMPRAVGPTPTPVSRTPATCGGSCTGECPRLEI
jgi:IS605 OrfB family transposase